MTTRVTNILDAVVASDPMKSTSALYHVDASTCPKCKMPMGTATIAGGETVHFCERGCRVSQPMQNLAK